jgi:L-fuculose-phosphate aldolase
MILEQFQTVGRDLFTRGLVSSNSGNLSIRIGDRIFITRRGCLLGALQENDLIETGVVKNSRSTPMASIELPVHRAIYRETQALAIVHAHPPHAIALSLKKKEIVPTGDEGISIMDRVPVVGWDMEVKPGGLADVIASALKEHKVIMARGHGSFAIGQLLEDAYNLTTALEQVCQIMCLFNSMHTVKSKK